MSIYFKEAVRRINNRRPMTPITKQQLYNILIDYGAFKNSTPLKYFVKHMIFEGFWSKAATLFNQRESSEEITKLKHKVIQTFGMDSSFVEVVFNSIFDSEEWNEEWNPTDLNICLRFEDIPIYGRTFDFIQKLIDKGYSWDFELNCLIGTFHQIDGCKIICNSSWTEVPIYNITVIFPSSVQEAEVMRVASSLEEMETRRISQYVSTEYKIPYHNYSTIRFTKINGQLAIKFDDGIGHGYAIDSSMYNPHNNLETID